MTKVALAFLLAGLVSVAQDSVVATWTTNGYANGRMWKDLEATHKAMYVAGFKDALSDGDCKEKSALSPPRLTGGEVVEAIDGFYAKPENRLISISFVMGFTTMKMRGMSQPTIDKLVTQARLDALSAREHRPGGMAK